MPWSDEADATRHTKLATTAKLRRLWLHVANDELAQHQDDGLAVKMANGAVKRAVEHREFEGKGRK